MGWFVSCWFGFAFLICASFVLHCPALSFSFAKTLASHSSRGSRCPRWFGVLEDPLMTLLSRITLHQGKGVAPHSEAPTGRTWRWFSKKIVGQAGTCFPSYAQASETLHCSSRDRTLNPPGKRWASPQSCLHQHTWRKVHIQRSSSIKPLNENMTRSFKLINPSSLGVYHISTLHVFQCVNIQF